MNKIILTLLCCSFLLTACQKSAQEKLAEQQLAEMEKAKQQKLEMSCAMEEDLANRASFKKAGYKMSQKCVEFLKKEQSKTGVKNK